MTSDCCCCCCRILFKASVVIDPLRSWEDCSCVMVTVSIPAVVVADMVASFNPWASSIKLLKVVTVLFMGYEGYITNIHNQALLEERWPAMEYSKRSPPNDDLCTIRCRLRMRNAFVPPTVTVSDQCIQWCALKGLPSWEGSEDEAMAMICLS